MDEGGALVSNLFTRKKIENSATGRLRSFSLLL